MKTAIFNYLNHHITIELSDPADGNTIYVGIYRATGTYDPNEFNPDLNHYQFSAESPDPNDWVMEGIKSAIRELDTWGIRFHEPVPVAAAGNSFEEGDDIPF